MESEAGKVGTSLSENLNNILGGESDFVTIEGTISNTLIDIKDLISSMVGESDNSVSGNVGNVNTSTTTPITTTTPSTPSTGNSNNSSTEDMANKWGFIKKAYSYSTDKLKSNMDTSIVDRLAYRGFDNSFAARASYYEAMGLGSASSYTGSSEQNKAMIKLMKENGFAKGGTIGSLIKSTGEDGFVLARTGEEVLSLEKISALKDAFISIDPIVDNLKNLTSTTLPKLSATNLQKIQDVSIQIGDIQMYGVNNPEEFASQLKSTINTDSSVRKILNDVTLGNALGKNTLTRFTK